MKGIFIIWLLFVSSKSLANPYDGRMSTFENGKEVTKSYHQILQEQSINGLSPLSKLIHVRALEVFDNPNSADVKKRYLAVFPKSFKTFMETFQPQSFDQLYDGFIYINLVDSLASEYPEEVGGIYLSLGSEACLDADAPNYLRHNLVAFESHHSDIYKNNYNSLTKAQQHNVEQFKSASIHSGGQGVCNF